MSAPPIQVAVVGHTNTGKTSLLRTLTRNAEFGEISSRPGTTRHVEGQHAAGVECLLLLVEPNPQTLPAIRDLQTFTTLLSS